MVLSFIEILDKLQHIILTFLAKIVVLGSKLAFLKNQIFSAKTILPFEYFETPWNISITIVKTFRNGQYIFLKQPF